LIILNFKPKTHEAKDKFVLVENQKMLLMPVGDVHEGSPGWPREKFVTHLQWGMDRGATFLGMGEFLDFASTSQRAIANQFRDATKEQLDDMIRSRLEVFLDLIKFTKGRWIGLLEGHHFWQMADGTTSDQFLCMGLDCPFLGTSALIRIDQHISRHPESDCLVYCHHGSGAGRTLGGKLNRVEELLKIIESDVYLMAHVHTKIADPLDRQYISPDNTHYHRTKLLARTGGFQRGYLSSSPKSVLKPAFHSRGTYIERGTMIPTSLGGLAIGIGYERIRGSQYYRPTLHHCV
jgi:hypothetical protein